MGSDASVECDPLLCPGECRVTALGYADDTYGLDEEQAGLRPQLKATEEWLQRTQQEVNAKKSVTFAITGSGESQKVQIGGVDIPSEGEFRSLGVGIRVGGELGTGPLLAGRIERARGMLSRVHGVQGNFQRRAEAIATQAIAARLYGVELADVSLRDLSLLETIIMGLLWGKTRLGRAKEAFFTLLVKGHRVLPRMRTTYLRVLWLTWVARTPGTVHVLVQSV